jgi:hypothetical protein
MATNKTAATGYEYRVHQDLSGSAKTWLLEAATFGRSTFMNAR